MSADGVDPAAQVEALLRVLRQYADSPIGKQVSDVFAELARDGRHCLAAREPGSPERQVEAVVVAVHQKLALIVLDMQLESGEARLEARRWLEDVDPGDFGGSSW